MPKKKPRVIWLRPDESGTGVKGLEPGRWWKCKKYAKYWHKNPVKFIEDTSNA